MEREVCIMNKQTVKWKSIDNGYPPKDKIFKDFSIPVLVANKITGQVWSEIVRYSFFENGWIDANFNEPDPCDYEILNITHWMELPKI